MSTYQYYEFRAIDRPLTQAQQQQVASLSSRVDLRASSAVFVYNYGSFRGKAIDVLTSYYDALFYIANWGTTRLAFRFPASLINIRELYPYDVEDHVIIHDRGDFIIVDIEYSTEGGYYDWIEGDGIIDGLLQLRDDILNGDYRILYLGWLMGVSLHWEYNAELPEPPIPHGMNQLNSALKEFVKQFHIDKKLLKIAQSASHPLLPTNNLNWDRIVRQLSADELRTWVTRLANGEQHLSALLRNQLRQSMPKTTQTQLSGRTAADIKRLYNQR